MNLTTVATTYSYVLHKHVNMQVELEFHQNLQESEKNLNSEDSQNHSNDDSGYKLQLNKIHGATFLKNKCSYCVNKTSLLPFFLLHSGRISNQ